MKTQELKIEVPKKVTKHFSEILEKKIMIQIAEFYENNKTNMFF